LEPAAQPCALDRSSYSRRAQSEIDRARPTRRECL
jgi:hypothetical protein